MTRENRLTRREMMRRSAGSMLAAGLWPGALRARDADPGDDFHFLVVNDTHYLDHRCGTWLEGIVKQVKARPEKIDFCLLVGDLAEDGRTEQLAPVRDLFGELGMPVHVVVGNHDYDEQDDRKPFEDLFPKSINYGFEHRGWQFLGLDSSHGRRAQAAVQPHTLAWLEDTLPKLHKKQPTVLFTHFPLGPTVINRATNADAVLERFKEYHLQAVYNGHFHGFTERRVGQTTLTTNRCCSFSRANHDGTKEKGFFLCEVKDGKIQRTFIEARVA